MQEESVSFSRQTIGTDRQTDRQTDRLVFVVEHISIDCHMSVVTNHLFILIVNKR
jgi:hypothetical protein